MFLPNGVKLNPGGSKLIGTSTSAIIEIESRLGYEDPPNDRDFDKSIKPYLKGPYANFQIERRNPAYSGAEHKGEPKLPNITVIPNLKTKEGPIVFGSSMGHHHDDEQGQPRVQEVYEFQTYGALLIDRDGRDTVELWVAKPGDKVVVPNLCNMTLYNLDDETHPLITLDFANPDRNKSNKDLIYDYGPILLGYYEEEKEAVFILNDRYININDPKYNKHGVSIQPPPTNCEVHISLESGKSLGEQLYTKLTCDENIQKEFQNLGIFIRRASPVVNVGGIPIPQPLREEASKGKTLYEHFFSNTPRIVGIGVPAGKPAQPAELMELPQPTYESDVITVRTLYTAVCATDGPYLLPQEGTKDPREVPSEPTVAFHEVVGEVIAVGREALAIPEGTWVVPLVRRCQERTPAGTFVPCRYVGSCSQAGRPDRCPRTSKYLSFGTGKYGKFGSQFWTDKGEWLVQVPKIVLEKLEKFGDDKYLCVLAEPMSIAQKAVRLAHNFRRALVDDPNPYIDNVLVVGLGPIGLLALFTLYEKFGYRRVYGADIFPKNNTRAQIIENDPPHGLGLKEQYIKVPQENLNYLFSVDIKCQKDLDSGNITEDLRKEFKQRKNISLPPDATVEIKEKNSRWLIKDKDGKEIFHVIKEEEKLNIYDLNFYKGWIEQNKAKLGEINEGRFQIIIEATGIPAVVKSLIPALAPDGVLVILSLPEGKAPSLEIPSDELGRLVSQNRLLTGCVNASKEDVISSLYCIAGCYQRYSEAMKSLIKRERCSVYDKGWLQQHINNKVNEIKVVLEW